VSEVSAVDGGANWIASEAPPRRQVVWQAAISVEAVGLELSPGDSLIRPQLADGGSTLFFTLRRKGGDADIFRSRLIDGRWQDTVPVENINSDSEDIGPSLTRDGRTLFLYSNRPGGFGGFDVYVSRRTAVAWSKPENLGIRINSVADEYDPSVSPDGTRLFYSSNRSETLQRRIVGDDGVGDANDWPATLRARATSATFDLFLAERSGASRAWQVPRPLHELNYNDSSEGAPFVSSNGAFIYFTSNRAWRSGETTNFDIYRARIVGSQFVQVENLGLGVNTAANEMEPALSGEGFQLFFSRNAERQDLATSQHYGLFASTATEITETRSWDDANFRALLAWISAHGPWMISAALLCGLLAGLIWYLRQVSLKRATVPGFFLSALLFHLMIVGSLFVIALDDDLRSRLKKEVRELVVAVQFDNNPEPEEGEPDFGNQADSQSVETVQPTNVQRQSVEVPPIETPRNNPRPVPPVPSKLPFVVPSEQIVTTKPELKMPTDSLTLERTPVIRDPLVEIVETIDVQPVAETPEPEPTNLEVDLSRKQPIAEPIASPETLPPASVASQLPPAVVPVERTTVQPPAIVAVDDAPALMRKVALDVAMVEAKVETVEVTAGESSDSQMTPTKTSVDVARQSVEAATPTVGLPPRRTRLVSTPAMSSESVPVERAGDQALQVRGPANPIALARADRPSLAESPESVPTETVAGPATPQLSAEPISPVIEVARQANQEMTNPIAGLPPRRDATMGQTSALTSESVTVERSVFRPVKIASVVEPIVLDRAGAQPDLPSESMATEDLVGPSTASNQVITTTPAQVKIARQEIDSALVPRTAISTTGPIFNQLQVASQVAPSRNQVEIVQASPAETPTTLAMLRRPAAAALEVTGPIETIAQATAQPGSAPIVDPSRSLAVRVRRSGEVTLDPKTPSSGPITDNATVKRQLTVDQTTIKTSTLDTFSEPRSTEIAAPLARVSPTTDRPAEEAIMTELIVAAMSAKTSRSLAGVEVGASRTEAQVVESFRRQVALAGLPGDVNVAQLAMTAPNRDGSHDVPEFRVTLGDLVRDTGRTPRLPFAEDSIGLQAMLRLRQSEAKKDLLEAFGGNTTTESAVARSLNWLKLHQHDDGQWSLNRFTELCEKHHKAHKCTGTGGQSDTAATGFALLPFLGAGHTHQAGDHREVVSRGLMWLVKVQKSDGDLFVGGAGNTHMYSHGIATIALCEAYAMTRDPALRDAAQKAIDFIVAAQHPSGGWRYAPRQNGDTSVFGWQIMALKSGQMAELNVPQATLDKAKLWLKHVGATGKNEGRFGYTNNSPNLTMTAEALLCLQYLGSERNDKRLIAGSRFLAENLPTKETSYYWYYGTQVMFHMQGEPWQKWNAALRNTLVETQVKQGSMAGTWDPKDKWEKTGGRVYATALRVLMLEVYYRHLPLYQVLNQ
jgi:hypothetical protein